MKGAASTTELHIHIRRIICCFNKQYTLYILFWLHCILY